MYFSHMLYVFTICLRKNIDQYKFMKNTIIFFQEVIILYLYKITYLWEIIYHKVIDIILK